MFGLRLQEAVSAAWGDAFVWLGLVEPEEDEFSQVAELFDLPPLAVEDTLNARQRPKAEAYGDTTILVLKTAYYVDEDELVAIGEVLMFIHKNFIISVRHGGHSLNEVRGVVDDHLELVALGTGAVVHASVDHVVDRYQEAVAGMANDVDEIERSVFSDSRGAATERIYRLEREVLDLNRATGPLSAALTNLERVTPFLTTGPLSDYFRGVHDHLERVNAGVGNLRKLLSSVLQANLTQVSIQQNNDMRTISAWVAIAAVPTMLAGIYGMNIEHMPELSWKYGSPIILSVMAMICSGLYIRFKRVHWL